ncbi:hypothetical protein FA13DRAFT_1753896 [Coprinellus micaceus]|uniref:N-acetyltransferase domain-containing protein n=1 Tax=Coprinellus micaceus TaxID=71717 RepID=A0A4Y7TLL3_COPMI|nr:hypothetical protein FA13DRAFT_1753896 [Coprinellus micaceus]
MKCNVNQVLVGSKTVLVPYSALHVPKYHEWMLCEELRELTASEPLSLEEEYEMQQKWQVDEDKLTFIILSREGIDLPIDCILQDTRLPQCPMVGDVNIFINGALEGLQSPLNANDEEDEGHAEVEIMIAEPSYRRRGYAREALQMTLHYATGYPFSPSETISSPLKISPTRLLTRISETNTPSISLFESLGFKLTKHISVFSEVEMRWSLERSAH